MSSEAAEGSDCRLKVGLCQVRTEQWDAEGNLERTVASLEAAAAAGAEVAITPECVLHGYADGGSEGYAERMLEAAEPVGGPRFEAVREKARALSMDVVFGFAEKGEGDRLHNSAAFITRDGEVARVYRKVH